MTRIAPLLTAAGNRDLFFVWISAGISACVSKSSRGRTAQVLHLTRAGAP
jgi:hypothetical protein